MTILIAIIYSVFFVGCFVFFSVKLIVKDEANHWLVPTWLKWFYVFGSSLFLGIPCWYGSFVENREYAKTIREHLNADAGKRCVTVFEI